MGNDCRSMNILKTGSYELPDLILKNTYATNQTVQTATLDRDLILRQVLEDAKNHDHYKKLIYTLASNKKETFTDKNFIIQGQNTKLSALFNYSHINMQLFSPSPTPLANFQQQKIQFSYLSAIMYYYANDKFLLKKALITKKITSLDIYNIYLFTNGEWVEVIVDDSIPTHQYDTVYLKMKGKQLWPFLIQKAWCKQVGSYQKAKGLSPEDAFQQITGIPAFSYEINFEYINQIMAILKESVKKGQWVCLVARNDQRNIQNRQVFYLEQIKDEVIYIRSPFKKFKFDRHKIQDTNMVKINQQQLLENFEYLIIGFSRQHYDPITIKVQSQKRQEKLFQIEVSQGQDVSIRFTQFYQGYLSLEDQKQYQYSPVSMELYNSKYQLIEVTNSQRSLTGAHSTYLTDRIFLPLSGKYYLKLEVDWLREECLCQGNIVVYSSFKNSTLKQLPKTNQKQLINEINKNLLQHQNAHEDPEGNFSVKTFQKPNQVLACISNLAPYSIKLLLNFNKSQNIRIKYGKMIDNKLQIQLQKDQQKIIQIVPQNSKLQFKIEPFDIFKMNSNV